MPLILSYSPKTKPNSQKQLIFDFILTSLLQGIKK